jgi:hypothetical protein
MASPRPVLYSVVGLMLVIILALTACVAMERVDRRVVTTRDAAQMLGVPSLGQYSRELPPAEADRLWARLALAGVGDEWHVLAVLPAQHEGGETAQALAAAAKRQGHSVILVSPPDDSEQRLTASVRHAEHDSEVVAVSAAGNLPSSVGAWRANGDLVILDLPAVSESSVGCASLRLADRVLLDVQRGADSEAVAEETLGALSTAHVEVVGAALFAGSVAREA